MDADEKPRLLIPAETARLIEGRGILHDDLQRVILHAEATGEKFINPSSGHSLAFLRPARVTYWVEYSGTAEGYHIHSAYSHRMEMKRGRGK